MWYHLRWHGQLCLTLCFWNIAFFLFKCLILLFIQGGSLSSHKIITSGIKLWIKLSVVQNCFKSQLSDHYSVDSMEKGECFDFESLLWVCLPYFIGGVYHFSLLICYPCSYYFHVLMMLVAFWEWKHPPFNDTGRD